MKKIYVDIDETNQIVFDGEIVVNQATETGLPCYKFAEELEDLVCPPVNSIVVDNIVFIEKSALEKLNEMSIQQLSELVWDFYEQQFQNFNYSNDKENFHIREDGTKPPIRWTNDYGLWLYHNKDDQTRHNLIKLYGNMVNSLYEAYGELNENFSLKSSKKNEFKMS